MHSHSILLFAAVASLVVLSPVKAEDYRILVQHASQTPTDFCNAWRCACINYVPKDKSLYFQGALCEPGDYHGQNTTTEAKVYCTFKNPQGTVQTVNKHVAAATGSKIIPDD